jgi:hypothetical protein
MFDDIDLVAAIPLGLDGLVVLLAFSILHSQRRARRVTEAQLARLKSALAAKLQARPPDRGRSRSRPLGTRR